MPLYEYRCGACGAEFDFLVRSNTTVACPDCGSVSLERLISAPFFRVVRRLGRLDTPAVVVRSVVLRLPVQKGMGAGAGSGL